MKTPVCYIAHDCWWNSGFSSASGWQSIRLSLLFSKILVLLEKTEIPLRASVIDRSEDWQREDQEGINSWGPSHSCGISQILYSHISNFYKGRMMMKNFLYCYRNRTHIFHALRYTKNTFIRIEVYKEYFYKNWRKWILLGEDERVLNWVITTALFYMKKFTGFIFNDSYTAKHPEHSLHETNTERNVLILMLGHASQTPLCAGFSTRVSVYSTLFRFKDRVSRLGMDLLEAMMQFMNTGMFLTSFQNGNIGNLEYTKQN